jgi:hypothetical protein
MVLGFECRDFDWLNDMQHTSSLATYFAAHYLKIQKKVCDEMMFGSAVLDYFPLRTVYQKNRGLTNFLLH